MHRSAIARGAVNYELSVTALYANFHQYFIGGDSHLARLLLKVQRTEPHFHLVDASFASTLPANTIVEVHDLTAAITMLRAGPSDCWFIVKLVYLWGQQRPELTLADALILLENVEEEKVTLVAMTGGMDRPERDVRDFHRIFMYWVSDFPHAAVDGIAGAESPAQ